MSRLAKKPIEIPVGTDVKIEDNVIVVRGPKGELKRNFKNNLINITARDGSVFLSSARKNEDKEIKMLLGTYASHIRNMLVGIVSGYEKKLRIEGVGYKSEIKNKILVLSLGFSHPVNFKVPDDISVSVEKNVIIVSGIDKEQVGLTSSKIRALKKPEPYKGKGIRYEGEIVRRKAGKKSAK